jgi:2'-5' RNA ligase
VSWFVAFPISPGPWFDALEPPAGLRKEHALDLHVTVAFFGNIEPAAAEAAFELTRSWPEAERFGTLVRLVPLGNPRRPSVIAATMNELGAFIGQHRDALYDAAGIPRDTRSPLAHITVARFGRKASRSERAAGIAWAEATHLSSASVSIGPPALYRSAPAADRKYAHSR